MAYANSFKKEINFLDEIEKQSDRGAAILLTSWLEEELADCLKSKFINIQNNATNVFQRNGPLSTLSSKIEISYLLGFISEENYKNLKIIKRVRNEFAHSLLDKKENPINFESEHIKNRCYSLDSVKDETFSSARHAFFRNSAQIHADISLEKDINYYSSNRI